MEPLSADSAVSARISAELANQVDLKKTPIEVIVDRGIVTLEGVVHSNEVKARIEEVVRGLAAGQTVVSEIEVKVHDPLRSPFTLVIPPATTQDT